MGVDDVLAFQPSSGVHFIQTDNGVRAELRISNANARYPAVFKVKTNTPERYIVKPHIGLLKAGETDRIISFTVQPGHIPSFLADMASQTRAGKRSTAFLILTYFVSEEASNAWKGLPSPTLTAELQKFWKEQEQTDKSMGKQQYSSVKFPAFMEGGDTEHTVSSDIAADGTGSNLPGIPESPAPSPGGAPAPLSGATPGPVPPSSSYTPAGSSYLPGMQYGEAVTLRNDYNELLAQVMQLKGKCDGMERRNARMETEIETLLDEKRQLIAECDMLRTKAAAAGDGLTKRAGKGADAADDEKAREAAAAAAAAAGFPLWQLVLVALLAFFLGRLLGGL